MQTFPDNYLVYGNRLSVQRQIGNAVPSALAEILGLEIRRQLLGDLTVQVKPTLIPRQRRTCPSRERLGRVPADYLELRGKHRPHPGKGLGPGARKRDYLALQPRAA